MSQTNGKQTKRYLGGCHCGAVRFEADIDLSSGASRCNRTLCTKRSGMGIIVKPSALRLLTEEKALTGYACGGKTGTFYFCPKCGIHVVGRGNLPQLGGDYAFINLNCIDEIAPATLKVVYWDGRHNNWAAGPREAPWPVEPAA
jgi:hypothetical protein